MKIFYYILFPLFFVLQLTANSSAQGLDPFCHVEVISGAPVWFYFNNASDYASGKTIQYNTVLRISYDKKPDKIIFHTQAVSDVFDGPSTPPLDSDNFKVKISDFRYAGPSAGQIFGFVAEDWRVLTTSLTNIGRAWIINNTISETNPVFYVYLTFSCSPKHAGAFTNLITDSYTNICNFSVQTWYTDATEAWPY